MAHKAQKDFAKDVATYLVGGGLGVLASKLVNDGMNAISANPVIPGTQIPASDAVVVGAGIVGAYYAEKKRKWSAKKLLVGVATAPVVTNVSKAVGTASWFSLSTRVYNYGNGNVMGRYGRSVAPPRTVMGNGMGKYGRGVVLQPRIYMSTYPRR